MNKNYSLHGIGLVAVILGLAAIPAANAQNNPHLNAMQMQTVTNLNNQRTQIDTKITTALSNRSITNAQAASFRAQLNANANLQNQFLRDGIIDVSETQNVMNQLNSIDSSITAGSVTNVPGTPNFGPGGRSQYRSSRNISRINDQRAQVESKLNQYLSSGRITLDQANKHRAKLQASTNLQNQYMATHSELTNAECDTLREGLEGLDNAIEFSVKYNISHGGVRPSNQGPFPPGPGNSGWGRGPGHGWGQSKWSSMYGDITSLETNITNQLTTGRSSGRLTNNEYSDLRASLDRIQDRTDRMRDSGGRFTQEERQAIVNQLNALQTRITTQINDNEVANRRGRRWQ